MSKELIYRLVHLLLKRGVTLATLEDDGYREITTPELFQVVNDLIDELNS